VLSLDDLTKTSGGGCCNPPDNQHACCEAPAPAQACCQAPAPSPTVPAPTQSPAPRPQSQSLGSRLWSLVRR